MPRKSGIGVKFEMILIGKNLSIESGKNALKMGSPGKKNKIKVTIDIALFFNSRAKSIPSIIYAND